MYAGAKHAEFIVDTLTNSLHFNVKDEVGLSHDELEKKVELGKEYAEKGEHKRYVIGTLLEKELESVNSYLKLR